MKTLNSHLMRSAIVLLDSHSLDQTTALSVPSHCMCIEFIVALMIIATRTLGVMRADHPLEPKKNFVQKQ